VIESEGRRLSQLLAEALEMAGIQSGRRAYRRDAVEVESLVEAALADCGALLNERDARVEREVPPGLRLRGDADALTRALRNLVENALKYGGEARWVGVRATDGGGRVRITVADRGPGIQLRDRPHVFMPFYRGRGVEAGTAGSGLGLAIVKEIVEAHGGEVSVEEGAGGIGSVFVMRLPAAEDHR
jgi:signal transduction histidine kinase